MDGRRKSRRREGMIFSDSDMSALKRTSTSGSKPVEDHPTIEEDSDVRLLREMGYSQELYRGFSPLMSFAFCFTAVNVLTSISLGFTFALNTGGSGVTVWSWFIGSFFTILIGLALGEICSVYPSAGSVYHWYVVFSDVRSSKTCSSAQGWSIGLCSTCTLSFVHLWLVEFYRQCRR